MVPISASRGKGIKALIERSAEAAESRAGEPAAFDEQRLAGLAARKYAGNSYILHRLHDRREHHGEEYRSSPVIDRIYSPDVMEALLRIEEIIEPKCMKKKMALRWSAVKIIDDDAPTIGALELTDGEARLIGEIVKGLEAKYGERDMIIADQKYRFICRVCEQCLTREKDPGELTVSDRIDKIATHQYLARPCLSGSCCWCFLSPSGRREAF